MPGDAAAVGQWETFYVIVGSSGGALTGLLFVVVALTADRVRAGTQQGLSAFTTPSIFHFCNVLFVSAMIAMPRKSLTTLAITLGFCALVGGYISVVATLRISRFEKYKPVAEDWIWHTIIPCVSYVALLVSAIMLPTAMEFALYVAGSVCLALLFVGIHNAWDVALYSVTNMPKNPDTPA